MNMLTVNFEESKQLFLEARARETKESMLAWYNECRREEQEFYTTQGTTTMEALR